MMNNRSKLCTKLTRKFLRKWWVVIIISLILLVFGALVALFFPSLVNLVIDGQIVLKEGSQTFDLWRKPPVHPMIKVYIYNVTNADEFLNNGEKPSVNELGPYVYIETWEKVDLKFHDNGTVSFNQQKIYKFSPEMSAGDEDDMVVVPNIPMLSATSQSKHAARFLRLAMASIMDILKIKPFVEVTVGQLLWGYEDPLLKLAKDVVPKEQKLPYEEFGLMYGMILMRLLLKAGTAEEILHLIGLNEEVSSMALIGVNMLFGNRGDDGHVYKVPQENFHVSRRKAKTQMGHRYRNNLKGDFSIWLRKNGTSPDRVTVFTGANDITKYGLIDRYNGKSSLGHWTTDKCNLINGSDGSIFPPHITMNTTVYVYDKDLCRLMPLKFKEEVETDGGVAGYRFSPPLDVFADQEKNPDNACFCPHGPPCAPNGFFNISACQYDSPILLSFPHFYLADQTYREAVDGVSAPDPEKHSFYMDIQPEMGVALRAKARVQLNLAVSQVIDIKQVATFPDIIFPIMWFEDGVDGLPSEVTDLLNLATKVPPIAKSAIQYTLFALGALMLVIAVTCLVRSSGRQETLNLEGTSHYVKPEKKKATNGHAANGHTNGKTLETLNPAFLNDHGLPHSHNN